MAIDTTLALVSLTDAKTFMQISGSSEDTIVGDLVNMASAAINKYCGRVLLSKAFEEYLDGDGSTQLILPKFPVTTLTSVNDDPLRVWGAGTAKSSSDMILDGDSGIITLFNNGGEFTKGVRNIKVVYTAGYAVGSMPWDIRTACFLLVSQWYRTAYQKWQRGVASEQVGNRNITFVNDPIPKDIALMLDPYRVRTGSLYA